MDFGSDPFKGCGCVIAFYTLTAMLLGALLWWLLSYLGLHVHLSAHWS